LISVDSGVDTFNPCSVDLAVITTGVGIVGLGKLHGFAAGVALVSNALRA